MDEHPLSCFRIKAFHLFAELLVGKFTEEVRERHDVLTALTQWKYVQRIFLNPMEQVLTETLFGYC